MIAWNMLYSYYADLPYAPVGLMMANQPWSGYYEVNAPIWATAHTTQFTKPGWTYLKHSSGVGLLEAGGSYVALVSPDQQHLTIVIETMDTSTKQFCLRAPAVPTKVAPQNATLSLTGQLSHITSLHLWQSNLYGNSSSKFFAHLGRVQVTNGRVTLSLGVNSIYTLTTLSTGKKAEPQDVPAQKQFPLPYSDDMNSYAEYQEADNFAQQVGVFEIRQTHRAGHDKVMRQVVLSAPIHWCPITQAQPVGVIGNYNWTDIHLEVDVYVPSVNATSGVLIGARMDQGGCTSFLARGVFFFIIYATDQAVISQDLERTTVVHNAPVQVDYDRWYKMALIVKGNLTTALLDNKVIYSGAVKQFPANGFVALGTDSFGLADFDNLAIKPV
jgi:galactosylceramidase